MHKIEQSLREAFSEDYLTRKLAERGHTIKSAMECIQAYEEWASCDVAEDEFYSCCLNPVRFNNGGLCPAVLEAFYVSWGLHNAPRSDSFGGADGCKDSEADHG